MKFVYIRFQKKILLFILLIYPLILIEVNTKIFRIQTLIIFLLSLIWLLAGILDISYKRIHLKMDQYPMNLLVLILLSYQLLRTMVKMFFKADAGAINLDTEILLIGFSLLYLVLYIFEIKFEKYFFDLMLYSGLFIFAALLYNNLCQPSFEKPIQILVNNTETVASFALLICIISIRLYCMCRDKIRSLFYAGVATVGFLILILNDHVLSLWLMVVVFIAMPVLFRPTAEMVKKNMHLFYIYLFLLSNMSIITNFTSIIQTGLRLQLKSGMYLDIILAVSIFAVSKYWDRIPQNVDPGRLVLSRLRRGYLFALKLIGITLLGFIIGGDRWKQLPDGIMLSAVKNFAIPLVESVKQSKSMFVTCLEHQGLIGTGMILIFLILMITKIQKNFSFNKPITGFFILISDVFLIQMLFWTPGINSLPIYFIFFLLAAFYKEDRERVTCIKFKQEGGDYGKE